MFGDANASVAVITRTKDRAITLRRAMQSVARQTYPRFTWVLVNDGGQPEPVKAIALEAKSVGVKVQLVHHPISTGRSAAANSGIEAVESRYVVWLDDDDSWHPRFLEECVRFLENNRKYYKGVITYTDEVYEKVVGGEIIRLGAVRKYPPADCDFISIMMLMGQNPFPPVSFVYDRSIYRACGGFDESVEYTEDWQFNQKFILKANIGIIPEVLAYYHQRVDSYPSEYANTMVAKQDLHILHSRFWREAVIRESVSDGTLDRGTLLLLQELNSSVRDMYHKLAELDRMVRPFYSFFALLYRVSGLRWLRGKFR